MSELKAHKTNPPRGELTPKHPPTYKGIRFRAFLKSDVEKAIHDQRQANNLSPLLSSDPAPALIIEPLVITDALTPRNTPHAYTLTREAIIILRSAKAWKYNREAPTPTDIKLNAEYVRILFSTQTTVNHLLKALHSDKNPDKGHDDPLGPPLHYQVALNFLIDIAKLAFDTPKTGGYPIIITTTYQPDYSGDLRPQRIKNIDINKPNTDPPFAWPSLCFTTSQPLPTKRILQPKPAAQPNNPLKRPSTPHP